MGINPPRNVGIMGAVYSYVVKKSHWGKGIGKQLVGNTMATCMRNHEHINYNLF